MEQIDQACPPAEPRTLIEARLVVSAAGAVMALVMGVTLGGAMKPTLATDGRPDGPQILTGHLAEGRTGPYDDNTTLAGYSGGRVPDYVLGSDTTRLAMAATAPPAVITPVETTDEPARAIAAQDAAAPAAELSHTTYAAASADDASAHAGNDDRASAETVREPQPQQVASIG